jgi:hypothetical protein
VFLEASAEGDNPIIPAIGAFRDQYTSPVWHHRGLVVTAIKPEA